MFPDILDGAKVLFYSEKDNYGEIQSSDKSYDNVYCYLAICKYSNDKQYYLFCCNENYEVVNDWLCDSVAECKRGAAMAYKNDIVWYQIK